MDTANSMRSACPVIAARLRRASCCYCCADACASSMTSPPPSYAGSAPSTFHSRPTGQNSLSPAHRPGSTNPCSASECLPAAPSVDHSPAEPSCLDTPPAAPQDSPPTTTSLRFFSAFLLPFARGLAPRVSLRCSLFRPPTQAAPRGPDLYHKDVPHSRVRDCQTRPPLRFAETRHGQAFCLAGIVLDTALLIENHSRTRLRIVGWPLWQAGVIGISGARERDPRSAHFIGKSLGAFVLLDSPGCGLIGIIKHKWNLGPMRRFA